jgi:hypothetical protein
MILRPLAPGVRQRGSQLKFVSRGKDLTSEAISEHPAKGAAGRVIDLTKSHQTHLAAWLGRLPDSTQQLRPRHAEGYALTEILEANNACLTARAASANCSLKG